MIDDAKLIAATHDAIFLSVDEDDKDTRERKVYGVLTRIARESAAAAYEDAAGIVQTLREDALVADALRSKAAAIRGGGRETR